jgi:hypothetical protein
MRWATCLLLTACGSWTFSGGRRIPLPPRVEHLRAIDGSARVDGATIEYALAPRCEHDTVARGQQVHIETCEFRDDGWGRLALILGAGQVVAGGIAFGMSYAVRDEGDRDTARISAYILWGLTAVEAIAFLANYVIMNGRTRETVGGPADFEHQREPEACASLPETLRLSLPWGGGVVAPVAARTARFTVPAFEDSGPGDWRVSADGWGEARFTLPAEDLVRLAAASRAAAPPPDLEVRFVEDRGDVTIEVTNRGAGAAFGAVVFVDSRQEPTLRNMVELGRIAPGQTISHPAGRVVNFGDKSIPLTIDYSIVTDKMHRGTPLHQTLSVAPYRLPTN